MEKTKEGSGLRKVLVVIPFLVMFLITPVYNILDSLVLVDVFGCGCVPIAQTNMFNIPYNANDLRWTVYGVLMVLMIVLGVWFSMCFKNKVIKVVYVLAVVVFNFALMCWICRAFMWG